MADVLEPGAVVGGRYRIRRLLGRGGMGVVYEAEHTSLGRVVALKMLVGEGTDPERVLRFLREARSAAQIGHPGIVDVFDLSTPGEEPFLVMERLTGEDLGQRIRGRQALPLHEVLRIGADLCAAVAAAHASGIVHRDLKPDNVFLARDPASEETVVKVLDFGIAKLTSSGDSGVLTQAGSIYGTPAYMAPEQMRSADVDARADVYSIGAIVHEALTGAPPFRGSSLPELVLNVTTEPPPDLMATRPDAPVSLARLVARCLSKQPEGRPSSAAELGRELERIKSGVPTDAPAPWADAGLGTLASSGPLASPDSSAPTLAPGGETAEHSASPLPPSPRTEPPSAEPRSTEATNNEATNNEPANDDASSDEPANDDTARSETGSDEPANTGPPKRSWPRRLLRFAAGATLVVLFLTGAFYAALAGLGWQRGRERLSEMRAFIDDGQTEFMRHLSERIREASEPGDLEGEAAPRLYRDLELYLLLTRPSAEGEPSLADDDLYALQRFARVHPSDSELATAELRRGYGDYLRAIEAQYVEVPDDIWAPRDEALVGSARARLAALPERSCAWASLASMTPAESYVEIGAPGLVIEEQARSLFTRDGYEDVGDSFDVERMCAQHWVLGTRSQSSTERLRHMLMFVGRARYDYREAYSAEWLRVLNSARWQIPEAHSRPTLREFLGRVVQEPASPAEQLAAQVIEQTQLEDFAEPEGEQPNLAGGVLGFDPDEQEREMMRELTAEFTPLSNALAPSTGLFARYRALVQELLVITVEVGDAPLEPAQATRVRELCARTRALVTIQDERFGPFFEAMLWGPVAFAQSVLLPEP